MARFGSTSAADGKPLRCWARRPLGSGGLGRRSSAGRRAADFRRRRKRVAARGETVEVIGFGGGRFRHFAAKVLGYTAKEVRNNSQLVVAFQPISGDSGGAVLYRQKLAGILWGGPCEGPRQPAYETHATCCIYINQFLQGLGCRPRSNNPQSPGQNPGGGNPAPPSLADPMAPAQPSAPSPADARLAAIERRLDDLADKLSRIAAGPVGPQGQPGPQGAPGPAGAAGKDADPAALSAVASRVAALEKNLKGKLHFSLQVDSKTGKILSTSSGCAVSRRKPLF